MKSIGQGLVDGRKLFESMQEDTRGFGLLAVLLRKVAGIHLPPSLKNQSLMASRLSSVIRNLDFKTYDEYAEYLGHANSEARQEFVSALTTNTTHFFRENQHYEILRKCLAEIIERKRESHSRDIRVWCAAASNGQEPYSIAMVLQDVIPSAGNWNVKFIATDIDPVPLSYGARGLYTDNEVSNIPPLFLQKCFKSVKDSEGEGWQVAESLRKMIRFAELNLVQDSYPFQHKFDIVFCRNVLIYFESQTASAVVHRLGESLSQGGYLFLGHSESGAMKTPLLTGVGPAVYQRGAIRVKRAA